MEDTFLVQPVDKQGDVEYVMEQESVSVPILNILDICLVLQSLLGQTGRLYIIAGTMIVVLLHQHHLHVHHLTHHQEEHVQNAVDVGMKVPHINMQQPLHRDGCHHIITLVVIPVRIATTRQTIIIILVLNVEDMDIIDNCSEYSIHL